MFQFIPPKSSFIDRKGIKQAYGNWMPEYYLYARLGRNQYLLVSNKPEMTFKNIVYTLNPVQCPIKGMMALETAGEYILHYKVFAE